QRQPVSALASLPLCPPRRRVAPPAVKPLLGIRRRGQGSINPKAIGSSDNAAIPFPLGLAMFRVFNCLGTEHNWRLVIVAVCVCFVASVTAINLLHRARGTLGRVRPAWIVGAGIMVGCGIWSTHFIAMLAYEPGVAVAYGIGLTALSLVAAMLITGMGLLVATS